MINKKKQGLAFWLILFGIMASIGFAAGSYYQNQQLQQIKNQVMRERVHSENLRYIVYGDMPAKERELKEYSSEGKATPTAKKTNNDIKSPDSENDEYYTWLNKINNSGEMDKHSSEGKATPTAKKTSNDTKSPDSENDEYYAWFNKTMNDSGEMDEILKLKAAIAENRDNPKKLAQLEAELTSKEDVILGQRKKFVEIMHRTMQIEQAKARMEASSDDYSNLVEYHKYLQANGSKDDTANVEKLLKDAMSDDLLSIKEFDEIKSFYSTAKKRISANKLKGIDS